MERARSEDFMLDIKNPEIDVDALVQSIQTKVQQRRSEPAPDSAGPGSSAIEHGLKRAREVAEVGGNLPAMSRTQGLARLVARPVAMAFLRIAQLITRDQRTFNLASLDVLRALYDRSAESVSQFSALRTEIAALREQLARTEANFSRVAVLEAGAEQARAAQSESARKIAELQIAISLQERRLGLLLEEARRRLPQPLDQDQLAKFAAEAPGLDDGRYLGFEDAFRGSRDEVKKRVSVYLPRLREGAGPDRRPILDVGCGRGELLELLREEGLVASGIDRNRAAVDQCRARNLDVTAGDLFEALGKIPDRTLGGLTAIHVVEHLPISLLFKLLEEAVRVLAPGGVAIFETPNPQNLLVGACTFYIDPTHRNPVHPQTLHYLVEERGLVRVETLMLHPYPPEKRLPEEGSPVARILNEYFYGPQDYAVVGRLP